MAEFSYVLYSHVIIVPERELRSRRKIYDRLSPGAPPIVYR